MQNKFEDQIDFTTPTSLFPVCTTRVIPRGDPDVLRTKCSCEACFHTHAPRDLVCAEYILLSPELVQGDLPPTLHKSHKQGSSCGPKGKSREELNLPTVVAKELDHLDLSNFPRSFVGDVLGRQVKSARVRHHVGITFSDVVSVTNLHITLPVPLAGRSNTWDPLGEVQRKFRKPAPIQANIQLLVNKFQRTGNVAYEPHSGRPYMPEQIAERIREAIERSPQASSRRLNNELDMPRSTVLNFTPKKKLLSHSGVAQTGRRRLCSS
ncbi:hypothetical protein ANN_27007 [Periplaneta americana]|uniref:Uncharacterized protein n=1 Tax=Periplaneta americana TaxID=6978 RepID=A0ABQ8RWZ1_PERAM|nr:hypothetical protein ANN_27007 [Periplaneta americana]